MLDENHVSLRFVGAGVDPDVITDALGMAPERSHRKGQRVLSRPGRAYPTGLWTIQSNRPVNEPIGAHLSDLLDRIEPKIAAFRQLHSRGYHGDLFCSYFPDGHQGRLEIASSLILRAAALELSLTVDVHCLGPEDEAVEAPQVAPSE